MSAVKRRAEVIRVQATCLPRLSFSGLLRGDSLKDTVNLAVKFIQTSLCETVKLGIHRNEGIEFEKHLKMLL